MAFWTLPSTAPRPPTGRRGLAGLVAPGLLALACSKGNPQTSTPAVTLPDSPTPSASGVRTPLLANRCHVVVPGIPVASAHDSRGIEVGDGAELGGVIAVGIARDCDRGRVAAVAAMHDDFSSVHVTDLGPTLREAPPARVVRGPHGLVAAAFLSRGSTGARDLAIYALDGSGTPEKLPRAVVSQQKNNDSFGFDIALSNERGMLVWDEVVAHPAGPPTSSPVAGSGVIRSAWLDAERRVISREDISPAESDAESPRVVAVPSGFVVFWIAGGHEEAPSVGVPDSDPEVNGEVRNSSWLEMQALDASGARKGTVHRLTPVGGHVTSFDARELDVPGKWRFVVVARDDGEPNDGAGGSLLLIRGNEEGSDSPTSLAGDGLGRGMPQIVDARPRWITWVDPDEELRLIPLTPSGVVLGGPSEEVGQGETRPILELHHEIDAAGKGDGRGGVRFLAVSLSGAEGKGPVLEALACSYP